MSEKISIDEIKKIASLSKIELTKEEISNYQSELSSVLGYIDSLQEVETKDIPITSQVTGLSNVSYEDSIDDFSDTDLLIKAAPDHEDNLIQVKAVFGD